MGELTKTQEIIKKIRAWLGKKIDPDAYSMNDYLISVIEEMRVDSGYYWRCDICGEVRHFTEENTGIECNICADCAEETKREYA